MLEGQKMFKMDVCVLSLDHRAILGESIYVSYLRSKKQGMRLENSFLFNKAPRKMNKNNHLRTYSLYSTEDYYQPSWNNCNTTKYPL